MYHKLIKYKVSDYNNTNESIIDQRSRNFSQLPERDNNIIKIIVLMNEIGI